MTQAGSARLRIATWNIHAGVGIDGRFMPARILRVIAELDADVLALQEVAAGHPDSDVPAWLRDAGQGELHFMAACRTRHGAFGNALLSRIAVASTTCVPLIGTGGEPRNAIDAHLEHEGRSLRLIATHLGLARRERRAQLAQLAAMAAGPAGEARVLLGDFNLWRTPRLDGLAMARERPPRTYPSLLPVAALDRILVNPARACLAVHTHRSRSARIASDHLPLIAEVALE